MDSTAGGSAGRELLLREAALGVVARAPSANANAGVTSHFIVRIMSINIVHILIV